MAAIPASMILNSRVCFFSGVQPGVVVQAEPGPLLSLTSGVWGDAAGAFFAFLGLGVEGAGGQGVSSRDSDLTDGGGEEGDRFMAGSRTLAVR